MPQIKRFRPRLRTRKAHGDWTLDPFVLARVNQFRLLSARVFGVFSTMPAPVVFAAGLTIVLAVGVVDYVTGPVLSLTVFYLVPIALVAWLLGRGAGTALALIACLTTGVADWLASAAVKRPPVSYWNDASLLAIFLAVVFLVTVLRATWTYDAKLVAEVQASLLPAGLPPVAGCDIAGEWRPAGNVGGDYYDVLPMPDGSLALCVADVSGKGMPAALLMSNLQAGVRALLGNGVQLSRLVSRLNALTARNVQAGRFITLFIGVMDPSRRRLTFCNAGHNAALLVRSDGSCQRLSTGGPVLGVLEGAVFAEKQVRVGPGDRLIAYTDGVTERGAAHGEEFGEARLIELARANRARDAAGMRDAIIDSVTRFGAGPFEDDLTVLVVAVT
jgi:serine phosphatase RsbU (regulator of sigma subunit)